MSKNATMTDHDKQRFQRLCSIIRGESKNATIRARRAERARARESALFDLGTRDNVTLAHLLSLPERRLLDVQAHALRVSQRPMHPDYKAAHVTLGALARLISERQPSQDPPSDPIDEIRKACAEIKKAHPEINRLMLRRAAEHSTRASEEV
jgi:hypothetical protein